MSKIYIASKPVVAGLQHLYLVYDPDNNPSNGNEEIIRGGPSTNSPSWGYILMEVAYPINGLPKSEDTLNSLNPYTDRNYTTLDLGGRNVETVWAQMTAHAQSLANVQINYDLLPIPAYMQNSNSVVTSILSAAGIDLSSGNTPKLGGDTGTGSIINPSTFPGYGTYMSGSGNDTLYGWGGNDKFVDLNGGSDVFYGGSSSTKTFSLVDGLDWFIYDNRTAINLNSVKLKQNGAEAWIEINDPNESGKIDTLYSIEQVHGRNYSVSNKGDFSNLNAGIELRDLNSTELANLQDGVGDFITTSVNIQIGALAPVTFSNFGNFIGTAYGDTFSLNKVSGRELNGGAGIDTADYSANGQGITVTRPASNITVNEGGGDVDTLLNMEIIKGTGHDDTFTFSVLPTSLTKIDAGAGYDALSFSSLGFGVSVFEKTAGGFKLYDTNGESAYEYSNFEDVTLLPLGSLILDDKTTASNYSTVLQQYFGGVDTAYYSTFDFSGAGSSGFVHSGYFGEQTTVTTGGGTDTFGVFRNVQGTQYGDTFDLGYYTLYRANYYTGSGNDIVDMRSAAGNIYYDNGATIHYRGGDDTYYIQGHLTKEIRLASTIRMSDVNVSILGGEGNETEVMLTIAGHGSLHIDATSVSGPAPSFWYDPIRVNFESGGSLLLYPFQFAGLPEPEPVRYEFIGDTNYALLTHYGTWGVDQWMGRGYENETYYAKGGDDVSYGNGGNDIIYAGLGNDIVFGGEGSDTLEGGEGNDILTGGNENDIINGGTGNDIAKFSGVFANYVINGATVTDTVGTDGVDTLISIERAEFSDGYYENSVFNVFSPDDIFFGTAAAETFNGGAGFDTVNYSNSTSAVTVDFDVTPSVGGYAAGDTLISIESVVGSNYNDTLRGNALANTLSGGNGNDTLQGKDGNDTIYGGNDNDIIEGGNGDDNLYGDVGNDTATYAGAASAVTVSLAVATSQNTGGAGNDTLSGIENLIGSAYADMLTGDGNANVIEGGAGNDTINGGGGIDTLSYASAGAGVNVYLETLTAQNTVGAGSDIIADMENVTGSAYNDTLNGNAGANILIGNAGNDTLKGRDGNDTIYGGDGNDTIEGNNGDDIIYGGLGADTLKGSSNIDTYVYLSAAEGGDTIQDFNTTAGEKIDLMAIMQNIAGFQSAQAFSAGYLRVAQNGVNTNVYLDIDGTVGASAETLLATLQNVTATNVTLSSFILPTSVPGGGNTAPVANNDSASTNEDTAVTISVLANDTDANSDPLSVSIQTNAAHGSLTVNGNNTVTYTPTANYNGADSFTYLVNDGHGGTASATVSLTVNAVNDAPVAMDDAFSGTLNTNITGNLLANNGNGLDVDIDGNTLSVTAQTLSTAHGSVTILANGNFTYTPTTGYTGSDSFNYTLSDGNGGSDVGAVALTIAAAGIYGTSGNDTINGTAGDDLIYGLDGNDNLYGQAGNDTLYGGNGADTLKGYDGNDIMYGGDGVDYLEGNNGDDVLYGGLGADTLKGSSNVDTFAWASMSEAGDTILDYNKTSNEKLDISDLLTGYDPMTSLITDFVQITDNGTNSFLAVDTDGTVGGANFVLVATLNAVIGMTDEAAQLTAGRLIVV